MRNMRGLALSAVILAAGTAANSLFAAPQIVNYQGAVSSDWSYTKGATSARLDPQQDSDTKPDATPLVGDWAWYGEAYAGAPVGIALPFSSTALGTATLDATLDESGFYVSGMADAYVQYDPADADVLDTIGAGARSTFSFNVQVPADGPDYSLALGGTTDVMSGYGFVQIRLTEFGAPNVIRNFLKYDKSNAAYPGVTGDYTTFDFDPRVSTQVLKHGKTYEFYVNAQMDPGHATTDASDYWGVSDTIRYDLTGTFTAVPEPTAAFGIIGAGLVALRRRREKTTR